MGSCGKEFEKNLWLEEAHQALMREWTRGWDWDGWGGLIWLFVSAGGFGEAARDEGGPARLMVCAEAATDVRVEVFVEQHAISPMGVGGIASIVAEAGAKSFFVKGEDSG